MADKTKDGVPSLGEVKDVHGEETKFTTAPAPSAPPTGEIKYASSLGVPATPPPPVGAVDLHKMHNEGDPTFDYTRNRQPEAAKPLAVESASEADKKAKVGSVSDDALLKACIDTHKNEKAHEMGAVSAPLGLSSFSIPWAAIIAMLKAAGLPLVKESLPKLRDRLAATSWPDWIKRPLLAGLDAVIAQLGSPPMMKQFQAAADAHNAK